MKPGKNSQFVISRRPKTESEKRRQRDMYDADAVNRRRRIEEHQERLRAKSALDHTH
ncbi:hypothetical protein [Pseudoalteromonas ruthenica]|uniref:hypothetical protein n=1 Tax=Pseudoalteromonas ruthenica TaxID=151081 RepID=UPI00148621BF|nr:hypothetical protein [Pseudoalteromonas ruthenica]